MTKPEARRLKRAILAAGVPGLRVLAVAPRPVVAAPDCWIVIIAHRQAEIGLWSPADWVAYQAEVR